MASGLIGLFHARVVRRMICTNSSINLACRRLTPVFIFIFLMPEALIASAMIYACTTFGFVYVLSVGCASTPE